MSTETPLEYAKRMVDWTFGTLAEKRWSDAEFNLKNFFEFYESTRKYALDDQALELDRLAVRANLALSLLKEAGMWHAADGWTAPFNPNTGKNIDTAAVEAQRAAQLAAENAARLGMTRYQKQAQGQIVEIRAEQAQEQREKPNAYLDAGKKALFGDLLGVPVWAWGLGALALVLYVKGRK